MINFITEKALTFVVCHATSSKTNNTTMQVYRYGIELLIASLINYLSIIAVGLVFGRVFESLIFLFCFATLRQYTGGYHANTYIWCNTVFVLSFLSVLFLSTVTCQFITSLLVAFILLVALAPIALLCPVEHPDKPIDPELNARCKSTSIVLWVVFSLIAVYLVAVAPIYGVFLFYTLLLVDVLVVIGEMIRRRCYKC